MPLRRSLFTLSCQQKTLLRDYKDAVGLKFWPRHLETKVILNGFERVISATLAELGKDLEDKVLCLKGDHPDLTWQRSNLSFKCPIPKKRKGI